MKTIQNCGWVALTALSLVVSVNSATAQGTAFTYQGQLNVNGTGANGLYDFRFRLAGDPLANNYVGSPYSTNSIAVANGLFTTTIDFGSGIFTGSNYWLEVDVRTNNPADTAPYTAVDPLQPLSPTPYAIMANSASNLLGNVPASKVTGTLPASALAGFTGSVSFNNSANSFSGNGTGLTNVNAASVGGLAATNFWQTDGNAGTTAGVNYLGTSDNQPLELHVNGSRVMRLEPGVAGEGAPNMIEGSPWNSVGSGVTGSVVGGGATNYSGVNFLNNVGSDLSFIGGGGANVIQPQAFFSVLSGGTGNTIEERAPYSMIGGGLNNQIEGDVNDYGTSVIAGGNDSVIYGNSWNSFIGGGGQHQIVSAPYATIAGGQENTISNSSDFAFIGGGILNIIETNSYDSVIDGGSDNTIQIGAAYSVIGGGGGNVIGTNSSDSVIGGGGGNTIQTNAYFDVLGGGANNTIGPGATFSFIGGGGNNLIQARAYQSALGGGFQNTIGAPNSVLAGGYVNTVGIRAPYSFMGGGLNNLITGDENDFGTSVIAGGDASAIETNSWNSFIGGGGQNVIYPNANYGTIVGGQQNIISNSSDHAFIGGGWLLSIGHNDYEGTIAGGYECSISDNAAYTTIGGGDGNNVSGEYGTIPGGHNNIAKGTGSFAIGQSAQANHNGALVWSDGTSTLASTNVNSVTMRASGGYRFYSSSSSGVFLAAGSGSWNSLSDRNAKNNLAAIDPQSVLAGVASLPISQWSYKTEQGVRHLGPMAQDFHAAFQVGENDTSISTVDEEGVALAAIQGLNQKLEEKDAKISALEKRLDDLEKAMQSLADKK